VSLGARGPASYAIALAIVAGAFAAPESRAGVAAGVAIGAVVAWSLRGMRSAKMAAALFALAAAVLAWAAHGSSAGLDGALARWFSPRGGLLYWNPGLWLGLAGVFLAFDDVRSALGVLVLAVHAGVPGSPWLAGTAAAFLAPAAMRAGEALRTRVARAPLAAVAGLLALSIAWNLLFMEQYRRNLIPRDDTVSFVDVAANNAALFSRAFGTPACWPASWLFALRHDVPLDLYEAAVGLAPSFAGGDTETIDMAVPPSSVLLVRGWPAPVACGESACRVLVDDADLLLRLPGAASIEVSVRMSGSGAVELRVNGVGSGALPVPVDMADVRVRLGAAPWRRGYNRLRFAPQTGASVKVSRIVLRQVGGRI
jgi:hypothetical protein